MLKADALIAEVASDLIDGGKAADDQPLQIELEADAQIEILVELVMVCDEGLSGGTAVERLQDRRLDFEEAGVVEVGTQGAHDHSPVTEQSACIFVGQQVHIATPVANFRIAHAVPFVRHRFEGFGQEGDLLDSDAQLAAASDGERAAGADEVAEVDEAFPDFVVPAVGQTVALDEELDLCAAIVQIGEADLTHHADALESAGNGHDRLLLGAVVIKGAGCGDRMGAVHARRIGVDPPCAQGIQLLQATLFLIAQVFRVEQFAGVSHSTCSYTCFWQVGRGGCRLTGRGGSLFDADDLELDFARRSIDADDVSCRAADQRLADRALVADTPIARIGFGRADDGVDLFVVVAVFFDDNTTAQGDLVIGRLGIVDYLGVVDLDLEFPNASFDKGLRVFGFIIAGIFSQIAFGLGFGDLLGDLLPPFTDQIVQLLLQSIEAALSQIDRTFAHSSYSLAVGEYPSHK